MLVLTRKVDECIVIGDNIEVTIVEIKGEHVKLGIAAPRNVSVHRKEIYLAIQKENIIASKANVEKLGDIKNIIDKKQNKK